MIIAIVEVQVLFSAPHKAALLLQGCSSFFQNAIVGVMTSPIRKIGIYSGTFDPVHKGHVAFAQAAIISVGLQEMRILPEREPFGKFGVTSFNHRLSMARDMFIDKRMRVLEPQSARVTYDDISYLVQPSNELYLCLGSDVVFGLKTWNSIDSFIKQVRFIIGVRNEKDRHRIHVFMAHMGIEKERYVCISTPASGISSSQVRLDISLADKKIQDYIQRHQLYTV